MVKKSNNNMHIDLMLIKDYTLKLYYRLTQPGPSPPSGGTQSIIW
jgi:hypothetical protein